MKEKSSKKPSNLTENQMFAAQQRVLNGYARKFALSEPDQGKLHMFFSGNRIPQGMTHEQVYACIDIFPLREWLRRRSDPGAAYLPDEFLPEGRMTASRFNLGMIKFKMSVAKALTDSALLTMWK